MVSYFERRKKPPLRHALSSRPCGPFPIQPVRHPFWYSLPVFYPYQKASNTLTCSQTTEKVAFSSELDNVAPGCTGIIYSALLLVHGSYKGNALFKALTSILCPRRFLFSGFSAGLSLIIYDSGKQWLSTRYSRRPIGHPIWSCFAVKRNYEI